MLIWLPFILNPLYRNMGPEMFHIFHLGISVGYVVYERLHWTFHHTNPSEGYIRDMKLYHM